MAIKINTQYPTKTNAPSAAYPGGSAKNVSSPGAGDGTPFEQVWLNDYIGFFQKLIADTGLVYSNTPDTVTASQYFQAMQKMIARSGAVVKAVDYTILKDDLVDIVLVDASVGPRIITLPVVADNPGRNIIIKKIDPSANSVRVLAQSAGETIDGVSGTTGIFLYSQYDALTVIAANGVYNTKTLAFSGLKFETTGMRLDGRRFGIDRKADVYKFEVEGINNQLNLVDTDFFTSFAGNSAQKRMSITADTSVASTATQFQLITKNTSGTAVPFIISDGQLFHPTLGTGAGTYPLKWNTGDGKFLRDTSSKRYKKNIRPCPYGIEALRKLIPHLAEYNKDGRTDVVFIAEEVFEVVPEVVPCDEKGRPDAVNYDRLVVVAVASIQNVDNRVSVLENELKIAKQRLQQFYTLVQNATYAVETQKSEIEGLKEQNRNLNDRLSKLEKLLDDKD